MKISKLVELKESIDKVVGRYISEIDEEMSQKEQDVGIISPPVDIYIDKNRQIAFMETPGMDVDSVSITHKDNELYFKASKIKPAPSGRRYIKMDRVHGEYARTFPLSAKGRQIENIDYSYRYGVVKITVQFSEV